MQIGNWTQDKTWWGRLDTYPYTRPVFYNSTAGGMSDVAGQITAALVSSALVIQDTDPTRYASLMADAVVRSLPRLLFLKHLCQKWHAHGLALAVEPSRARMVAHGMRVH